MTTIGELVAVLFAKFEREYRDERRAAVATQEVLEELLRQRKPVFAERTR